MMALWATPGRAADRGDDTRASRSRHHRVHKAKRAEPPPDDDAAHAPDAEHPTVTSPAATGAKQAAPTGPANAKPATPSASGKVDTSVAPPASALPEPPPTDPNTPTTLAPDLNAAAPAASPNDTVEPVETVDATPAAGSSWYTDSDPVFDRFFDQYTVDTVRRRSFNTYISHRNREGILRGPFYDLLGFDGGGLKVGLAVRYGILDDLDAGIYRQNGTVEIFDTWEFDGRYRLLRQSDTMPVSLGVRAGLTWFSASGMNALAGFGEAMVNRRFFNALLLGVNLIYHSNSSSPAKRNSDTQGTGGIGVMAEWRLLDYLAVDAEVTVGVLGYSQKYPAISVGPKFITNRHTFSINISNTQAETTDGIITNTWRTDAKDWLLGFNISREL